ncbi:biosynthetic-type acetolactate synthase large subunit [Thermoflexibacter ruber]|uniref:Acetolactate synthase n=1 Tax=Thermoflexibacter ruber TaxID=1003 RepID=A0A1I2D731_9BACT|nr:biosynthetic-type acetolactate synthase large subunit [Thermoflexibacter ruber]SFE76346.1 acetolactate synthase, large subunit [Thermoflexibacter ruber]
METLLQEVTTEKKPSSQKLNITGAEAVVLSLLAEGVECVFGYPGGAIMPVYDAFYHYQDKLKHYLVRHEQGAIHAAQGYARVKGKAGVAIATSGPGATNLITGIADAMIDSTPVVCITGQVFRHLLGSDAFQEVDVISVSLPITKWNFQVTRAEEIPTAIAKAFYIAQSGRPGPVLIDITKNAQNERFDFEYHKCTKIRSYFPRRKVDMNAVEAAADLLNSAKKPLMLVGQGVILSKAEKELKEFAEKSGIPVASTLLGLSAFSTKHPLYVGYLGMHGNYGPNIKTNECDVLLAVGMRFDDRVTGDLKTYAKQAKVIHIEIDPAEIDKNVKTTVAIIADAKEALIALTEKVTPKSYPDWLQEFADADRIEYEKVVSKDFAPNTEKIKMAEVIKMLSDKTEGKAIIATDVGQHQMTTTRYYQFTETDSNITSGGAGTMGFCLPAAIGAKVGRPDRQVIAIIGDGGFQMTMQELGVIMQYKIPVKIIILNNNFLGMVRQWQQLFFDNRYSSVDMENPDFIKLAEAFSIKAQKVETREELSSALDAMLESPEAYFLEICVEKETNVFPMVPAGAGVGDIRLE